MLNLKRIQRKSENFFENLVFIHLKVLSEALNPKASLYFLRTHTQREIDFILEYENKLLSIEVKLTDKPSLSDARHLLWFIEEHPQATAASPAHRKLDQTAPLKNISGTMVVSCIRTFSIT